MWHVWVVIAIVRTRHELNFICKMIFNRKMALWYYRTDVRHSLVSARNNFIVYICSRTLHKFWLFYLRKETHQPIFRMLYKITIELEQWHYGNQHLFRLTSYKIIIIMKKETEYRTKLKKPIPTRPHFLKMYVLG